MNDTLRTSFAEQMHNEEELTELLDAILKSDINEEDVELPTGYGGDVCMYIYSSLLNLGVDADAVLEERALALEA